MMRWPWKREHPKPIRTDLLVYGECAGCRWKCACGEGERWPKCPYCKTLVMPPRPDAGLPRYAYVAAMYDENTALAVRPNPRGAVPLMHRPRLYPSRAKVA